MVATLSDVSALQATTAVDSTNLSIAVASCLTLTDQDRQDWYVLAARALAFVGWSPTGGSGIGVDAIWAEGQSLRSAMAAWYQKLTAAGCAPRNFRQTPAPPPPPGPGLLDRFSAGVVPLVLVALYALYKGGRR